VEREARARGGGRRWAVVVLAALVAVVVAAACVGHTDAKPRPRPPNRFGIAAAGLLTRCRSATSRASWMASTRSEPGLGPHKKAFLSRVLPLPAAAVELHALQHRSRFQWHLVNRRCRLEPRAQSTEALESGAARSGP
jgi:hypothetical protein